LKELGESLAQIVANTSAALQAATAEVARAAAEDEDAKRQAALMGRLAAALTELRAHEETRAGHGEREARLAEARRAEPVRPLLEALADAEAAAGSAADDLADLLPGSAEDPLVVERAEAAAASRADGAEAEAAALQRDVAAEEGLATQRAELDQLERDL